MRSIGVRHPIHVGLANESLRLEGLILGMPFSEKERAQYLAEKRKRESGVHRDAMQTRPQRAHVCVHCQKSFGVGEGSVSGETAVCDTCLGS
jgi:hypothetical protein